MRINIVDDSSFFSFFTIRDSFLRVSWNEQYSWITLKRNEIREDRMKRSRQEMVIGND
jgi:hypothetical protein